MKTVDEVVGKDSIKDPKETIAVVSSEGDMANVHIKTVKTNVEARWNSQYFNDKR